MTLDRQCDDVLSFMIEQPNLYLPPFNIENKYGLKIKDDRFPRTSPLEYASIVAVLINDELIQPYESGYRLTNKGLAFYHTDTYINRSKRWELEQKVKEQELTKLNWEVRKMRPTYIIAVIGLIVAILSFLMSALGVTISSIYTLIQQVFQ